VVKEKHSLRDLSRGKSSIDRKGFAIQSSAMEPNWAADHLQVIRTLMERSAVYRRALAPIMIFVGVVGLAAACAGYFLKLQAVWTFILYWYGVGAVALTGAFLMVRRQAWQQAEPLWSPPTRRVALAMLPALTAGFLMGTLVFVLDFLPSATPAPTGEPEASEVALFALPLVWVILYGCAIHAAGFFMPRGIRLLGWLIIILGCAALFARRYGSEPIASGHVLMGFFFGTIHLAYGIYLYFTEQRRNEP
jgi:hypothetical protein